MFAEVSHGVVIVSVLAGLSCILSCCRKRCSVFVLLCKKHILADRTNGRAYATVLRLFVRLSVVCGVMYCG